MSYNVAAEADHCRCWRSALDNVPWQTPELHEEGWACAINLLVYKAEAG